MQSLVILIAAAAITFAFYFLRRAAADKTRLEALAFVFCYCLTLAMALRFGARTYPGIHFPNSMFLNNMLNGSALFSGIGYFSVIVAGLTDMALIFLKPLGAIGMLALKGVKWTALSLAISIAIYGLFWAAALQRLP